METPAQTSTVAGHNALIEAFNSAIQSASSDRFGARDLQNIARGFEKFSKAVEAELMALHRKIASLEAHRTGDGS